MEGLLDVISAVDATFSKYSTALFIQPDVQRKCLPRRVATIELTNLEATESRDIPLHLLGSERSPFFGSTVISEVWNDSGSTFGSVQ